MTNENHMPSSADSDDVTSRGTKTHLEDRVLGKSATSRGETAETHAMTKSNHEGSLGMTLGLVATAVFYGAIYAFPHPWLMRYFLGHWVCVAATLLFSIAAATLLLKWLSVSAESKMLVKVRDSELSPAQITSRPADNWLKDHHAGHVAASWLRSLEDLPHTVRRSRLVGRLTELLERQSGRVTTQHLADDMRELSIRDSDAAHESLQLVRIIVWAIPMLGFLGTVVGITQTLGDLDFTNGDAAIANLKTGLYVAFDTTAIGLVLSVLAIFLQFPVEKAEGRLLGDIDHRVTSLLNGKLPSEDASQSPAGYIATLCDGIRAAVQESLAAQAALWRQTIDDAHLHWQNVADDNGQRIGQAILESLSPALHEHAHVLSQHAQIIESQTQAVETQSATLHEHIKTLDRHSESQVQHGAAILTYTDALTEVHRSLASEHQARWTEWSTSLTESTRLLTEHQQVLIGQLDEWMEQHNRTDQLLSLQSSLDNNLLRLSEANVTVQNTMDAHIKGAVPKAMLTLASAVEVLASRLDANNERDDSSESSDIDALTPSRRAA